MFKIKTILTRGTGLRLLSLIPPLDQPGRAFHCNEDCQPKRETRDHIVVSFAHGFSAPCNVRQSLPALVYRWLPSRIRVRHI